MEQLCVCTPQFSTSLLGGAGHLWGALCEERRTAEPRSGKKTLPLQLILIQKLVPFHSRDSISQPGRFFFPQAPRPTPVSPRCHPSMSRSTELRRCPESGRGSGGREESENTSCHLHRPRDLCSVLSFVVALNSPPGTCRKAGRGEEASGGKIAD